MIVTLSDDFQYKMIDPVTLKPDLHLRRMGKHAVLAIFFILFFTTLFKKPPHVFPCGTQVGVALNQIVSLTGVTVTNRACTLDRANKTCSPHSL